MALAPLLVSVAVDFGHRGSRILAFSPTHLACYVASSSLVCLVWALFLYSSALPRPWARRTAAALFVFTFTFTLGGQEYFFDQYRSYLNSDMSLFAVGLLDSVVNQLLVDTRSFLGAKLPYLCVATLLVLAARAVFRPRWRKARHAVWLTPSTLLLACVVPVQHRQWQAAPPEALYFNAVGGFLASNLGLSEEAKKRRPRERHSQATGPLQAQPSRPRNVLLVITESVRADAACSAYSATCQQTPYTNALLPQRLPLTQLRAADSTTATSLAVLWSGLSPNEDSEAMHSWPLLFDYANAAGWDTAFFTSQNLMFGNSRLWVKNLGARLHTSGTNIEPAADLDLGADEALLATYVEEQWPKLREPFLAVVQLSNTHYPYMVKADRPQPFQPSEFHKGPNGAQRFRNYYQNAVVQQDQHLARMIAALRSSEAGQRTVIVYTADHGEAFREHHQLGHTFTLYDEEIKVPGFVDAPAGTLSPEEQAQLEAKAAAFVFHVDIAPTVLDLMGLRDAPGLEPFRRRMFGQSWLREEQPRRPLPLTNCTAVWSCAFENWGVMQGSLKVLARTPYDLGWRCFDLKTDPKELNNLDTEPCAELKMEALRLYGRLPQ